MRLEATADDIRPQAPEGPWRGLGLSALVHGVLLAALLWGVRWEKPVEEPIAAELWASVPLASPAPPPPPPAPAPKPRAETAPPLPDADIGVQRERERQRLAEERQRQEKEKAARERAQQEKAQRLEKEKAEQLKLAREQAERDKLAKAKAEAERAAREAKTAEAKAREAKAAEAKARDDALKQAKAAEERDAKQRESNLARMMGQLGAAGGSAQGTGTAAAGGPSASYAGRIVAAIKPNIVFAETLSGNPAAEVEVRAGPGGTIIGRTLVKSSGHPEWDEAVLRAIDRTGTLPRDTDGRVPSRLTISFRPRD